MLSPTLQVIALVAPFTLAAPQAPAGPQAVGAHPSSLRQWVDFDGDGLRDLHVYGGAVADRWLRNTGDGSFAEIAAPIFPVPETLQALWADFDADGRADLFRIDASGRGELWHNLGEQFEDLSASLGAEAPDPILGARWIDFDQDGRLDLELESASGVHLLQNQASGGFVTTLEVPLSTREIETTEARAAHTRIEQSGDAAEAAARETAPGADQRRAGGRVEVPERPGRGTQSAASTAKTTPTLSSATPLGPTQPASQICVGSIGDFASPGNCIPASSIPMIGSLLPLGTEFFVSPTGDVGFGTSNPARPMHLLRTGSARMRLQSSTFDAGVEFISNSTGPVVVYSPHTTDDLRVNLSGVDHFTVKNTGQVGIGTTSPTHDLHVSGGQSTVRLEGPDPFGAGARLDFGDQGFVFIEEDVNDHLAISAVKGVRVHKATGAGFIGPALYVDSLGAGGSAAVTLFAENKNTSDSMALLAQAWGTGTAAQINNRASGPHLACSPGAGVDVFKIDNDGETTVTVATSTPGGAPPEAPALHAIQSGTGPNRIAVWGEGFNDGDGVRGETDTGNGVHGIASSWLGYGVSGVNSDIDGIGVNGISITGTGVQGFGEQGVLGSTSTVNGSGVIGQTIASSGFAISARAFAPAGFANAKGVWSQTDTEAGDGIAGFATHTTGPAWGVRGETASPAGYGVHCTGDLAVTGTKNFIQPHPTDPSKQIRFTALEGNESGTYFRGNSSTSGGFAKIQVPEEFLLVTAPKGLTVSLTARGPALLWYESASLNEIVVRSNLDVAFDYVVMGQRLGFTDLEPILANDSFIPSVRGVPFGTQYPQALREVLVQNGTLNSDYTPNLMTAATLGWTMRDAMDPIEVGQGRRSGPSPKRPGEQLHLPRASELTPEVASQPK